MKLTLTYVNRTERTSAKTNKPYTSISIKAKEYGDKYLSGFGNKENAGWKEGDTVEVAEVTSIAKGDKLYLNFEMPKAQANGSPEVMKLLTEIANRQVGDRLRLDRIIAHLSGKDRLDRTSAGTKVPDFAEVDDLGPLETLHP